MNTIDFNDEQLLRYSRQIMLPQFGVEGQQRLLEAHIIIMGVGGLGSPAALYLVSSGIGKLTLVDFDVVDNSNLQRQIIHNTNSLGLSKVDSAKKTLLAINPDITIETINEKLNENELASLFNTAHCIIDATDNFATRFAINRACVAQKKPLVSAAAIQYEGQISVFNSHDKHSVCYACLYNENIAEDEPVNCSDNGILAPVVGILGSMQALEAIKIICNLGDTLQNRLLIFDALTLQWRSIKLNKDPACSVCATNAIKKI